VTGAGETGDFSFLHHIQKIVVWRKGGQRAPHKPLLLLFALGRLENGKDRLVDFGSVERPLQDLLQEFGVPSNSRPQYPFWRLRHDDGIWEVPGADEIPVNSQKDPRSINDLRKLQGGFPLEVYEELKENPLLVHAAAMQILNAHFPLSLHENILAAVGLCSLETDLIAVSESGMVEVVPNLMEYVYRRVRDRGFARMIRVAYQDCCAFCDWDGQIEETVFGLEAAHVRWHSHAGPDTVENGLALCALHHKAFDKGVLGLDTDRRIIVSPYAHGESSIFCELVHALDGRPVRLPQAGRSVASEFIDWHYREVFRSSPQPLAS